ncbi:MAG: chemotaxis protein CheX [Sedimentisphaerales bacterium]|nr:chemotaxis protein CheX [Sedimentisphaerales bacterium]
MVTTVSLKDALLGGAQEVFETMVFMALEEVDVAEECSEDVSLLGSITFTGNIEGCLSIRCGLQCARTIAANMLGTDPCGDLAECDINDAIGEVANMVMGAIKSRVQHEIGTMEVSIPSVVQGREMKHGLGDQANEIVVNVSIEEQYRATFSLLFRESELA